MLLLMMTLSGPVLGEKAESSAGDSGQKVYRTTDEKGRPVFSDQASGDAQEVKVEKPMTFPAGRYADQYNRVTAPDGKDGEDEDTPADAYKTLAITSPTQDEDVRGNAGELTISFAIEPALRPGHSLQLMMDGSVLQQVRGREPIALENVDRGTHQVQLQVTDVESGTVLQQGAPISFTFLRHSILNKNVN